MSGGTVDLTIGMTAVNTTSTTTPPSTTTAAANYALKLAGTGDYASVPNTAGYFNFTTAFTVEAWVKPFSLPIGLGTYSAILQGASTEPPFSGGAWVLFMGTGNDSSWGLSVCVPGCNAATSPAGSLQANVWQHIAATYNGSTIAIYRNGALISTAGQSGNVSAFNFVLFGIWERSLNGLIDEVRIWNVALPQSTIQANMNKALAGTEAGLIGYWRFDEGAGTSAADSSGHGKTATLKNGASWGASAAPLQQVPVQMGGSIQGSPLALANTVTTFAGLAGTTGTVDGIGSAALFNGPFGVATDGTSLFVADRGDCTVRKVIISTGQVTTLAGTANSVGSTDATGTAARFYRPTAITTDGTNLYVTDDSNNTVRKIVIATGAVTTIAGLAGTFGSADGIGSAARFNPGLYGITTDGTNLYVADTNSHTIRKIVIATGEVTTIAGLAGTFGSADGTGSAARFKFPYGITTDGNSLFVADDGNHTIRKIVIATGAVTTIAGVAGTFGTADGIGSAARLNSLQGITTDGTNLFESEGQYIIRKIVIATGEVTTIAGSAGVAGSADGTGATARFNNPFGMTTDGTSLFLGDAGNQTIRRIQ